MERRVKREKGDRERGRRVREEREDREREAIKNGRELLIPSHT